MYTQTMTEVLKSLDPKEIKKLINILKRLKECNYLISWVPDSYNQELYNTIIQGLENCINHIEILERINQRSKIK